jgi:uncharacterized membrane protein YdjX (TVP38/TMEM64 family)
MTIEEFIEFWRNVANQHVALAPLICMALGFSEALLPFLPLFVLIAFSISTMSMIMGPVWGTAFGILLPAAGSIICVFLIFIVINKLIGHRLRNRLMKHPSAREAITWVEHRSDFFMIAMMSNPYAPISVFNYGISLTDINYGRYFKIVVFSRIIQCILLGILGIIFGIQTNPERIIWVVLVFILIYTLLFLIRYYSIKRKKRLAQAEK